MDTTQFRVLRLKCHIPLNAVAAIAGISSQRLSQLELGRFGYKPQNPKRLIKALEEILRERHAEYGRALDECLTKREALFELIDGSEAKL